MSRRQQGITARKEWPQILERLAEYAAQEIAPTTASKEISREFGGSDVTIYHAIQRGEVPHYKSTDRRRAQAWAEDRARYLRSEGCIKCDGRVFYTGDARCVPCDSAWKKKHRDALKASLARLQESGEFYTGRGETAPDKLFFGPKEAVEPFRRGMKLHAMAAAMLEGATLDELSMITGWIPEVVTTEFYQYLREKGYGVERRSGRYYLLLPPGGEQLPLIDY